MVRIITDSVAGLSSEEIAELDVDVVSLYVNYKGIEHDEATMDIESFYQDIEEMIDDFPVSSQPSPLAFEEAFESCAKRGEAVVGIFMSSGLSGTYEGAVSVAREVKERYPKFECALIDSATACHEEAFPLFEAIEARDNGGTYREVAEAALACMDRTRFLFTPRDLSFLQRGGRIGRARALLGNALKLVPILTVSDGEAAEYGKTRSQAKALKKICETFKSEMASRGLKRIMVHYIGHKEPALEWARSVIEPLLGRKVEVRPASPVIGVHIGPAVGLCYECEGKLVDKWKEPLRSRLQYL